MNDEEYMRLALGLAVRGRGHVSPNPMVGAVVVADGQIIGQGWHRRFGDLHAERDALRNCTASAKGATMYVTLEPCCHTGKQPPCTDALVDAGVSRVVVGSNDPNPLVAGKGIELLRASGIEVSCGVLKQECDKLNVVFFHYITTGRPYVVMKYAMSMDGKIACSSGDSKWVTGEQARAHVHETRKALSSIMVGVGTVLVDDPLLTCRIEGGVDPVRVVCDTHLKMPLGSQLVKTAREVPTIIATCNEDQTKQQPYVDAGCEVVCLPVLEGRVDLEALMDELGKRGIDSVFLEGGATLNWSALEAGLVNQVHAYVSPQLFGGATAKSPVGGQGFVHPVDAVQLAVSEVKRYGDDYLFISEVTR